MEFIKNVIRGITIGIANVVPGVSGGTIMVSLGIYDELLQAVTGFFRHKKESILKLFPYLFGMGIGIICLSFMIGYLFENFPFQTAMLFYRTDFRRRAAHLAQGVQGISEGAGAGAVFGILLPNDWNAVPWKRQRTGSCRRSWDGSEAFCGGAGCRGYDGHSGGERFDAFDGARILHAGH